MNIEAKTIPQEEHRYPTVGDYWDTPERVKKFRISEMGNEDMEFLVLIHELVEEHLTRRRGILEPDIKAFDEAFEAKREEGNFDEPGDSKDAPYHLEHVYATYIERQLAHELGVDWKEYENVVNAL